MNASIIIVTRNRAEDLKQTLNAMRDVQTPDGLTVELLLVDNGSTDLTAEVVRTSDLPNFKVRYFLEGRPGLSNGRNRALSEANGAVLMFTDDDIRPPAGWIEGMCDPIFQGKAKAVAGGVRLAASLLRPWMTSLHRSWLASSEWLSHETPESMVGANMAIGRDVLKKIPAFDPELGAGALGSGEESLFSSQLLAAGYGIFPQLDLCVEHHFQESRLYRASWLDAAEKLGLSHAYRGHHWEHWGYRFGKSRLFIANRKLAAWRAGNAEEIREEGCSEDELKLVYDCAMIQGHINEHKRPRNYQKRGLIKIDLARQEVMA